MADESRSLFLVARFDDGRHCGAIYEIEIGGGGAKFIDPPVKFFTCPEERYYSRVSCDIIGSEICLMGSYSPKSKHKLTQFQPLLFNTNTKDFTELPKPKVKKPYPRVMAVHERGFYMLCADTLRSCFYIKSPTFERLDHLKRMWDDSAILPDNLLPQETSLTVSGHAVVEDNILISVEDASTGKLAKFFCYKVGSSMKEWRAVEKENEKVTYYSFDGKAEYVDGLVYTLVQYYCLIAHCVSLSADGIIQTLGAPQVIMYLMDPPVDPYGLNTSSFVYLGNRTFCVARTEFCERTPKVQDVAIITVDIDKKVTTSISVCTLDREDLGQAQIRALCFDSPQSNRHYKSERCTSLKDRSEYLEDQHLQPMDTDPPKLESGPESSQPARKRAGSPDSVSGKRMKAEVDDFLQLLGLGKYSNVFSDNNIDMPVLLRMTDEELKDIGVPKDPREKILLALASL